MYPLPQNNPFLKFTPEMAEKVEENLRKSLRYEIRHLYLPGEGKTSYVANLLRDVQEILKKFQEFGHKVIILDERDFPELAEAIGVLKRGGLEREICEIILGLLEKCNIPKFELLKAEVLKMS